MKITILNYTGKEANWGCQATSNNIIQLFKKYSDDNISFEFIEIEYKGNKFRKLMNKIRLKLIDFILNNLVIFTNLFKYLYPIEKSNIEKIENCDMLILNGEGSLHGYNAELIKFVQYLAYAKKMGKKTAIINHSLQFDNEKAKRYLSKLYTYSDINYFREELSLNNAKTIGIENIYLVPDAAFLNYEIDTTKVLVDNLPSRYIASSGSVIIKENNKEYFDLLTKLGKHYDLPIVFIASCEVDKNLKEMVTEEYGFIYFDETQLQVAQVQKVIKDSQFFYSGRFHLNIFAATAGKIFIPFISNTVKMQGFLNLIDYPIKEISIKNIDVDSTFNILINFLDNNKDIENYLLDSSKKHVAELYKKYKELLD